MEIHRTDGPITISVPFEGRYEVNGKPVAPGSMLVIHGATLVIGDATLPAPTDAATPPAPHAQQ